MSFSCPHIDLKNNDCIRLKKICVPGRPGCVLIGKVSFTYDVKQKISEIESSKINKGIGKKSDK